MKKYTVLLLCIAFSIPLEGRRGNAPSADNVQLPADFAIDFQLGLAQHSKIVGSTPEVTDGPLSTIGSSVFDNLTRQSMIEGLGLPYKWHLAVLNDNVVNAHSGSSGEVVVNGAKGGMAEMLGAKPGLWAAVLSHEISHTANRHQVRQYIYQQNIAQQMQYYRWRVQAGDKSANWSIIGLSIAAGIAEKKMGRDQEHEADLKGMMLMARAGYHPDNVFALHHLSRLRMGDQSKFGAFFSDHPRWETRDQRDQKEYADALAEFERAWPLANLSPGGDPPVVAFITGKPSVTKNKQTHSSEITIPASCRNSITPIAVLLKFSKDGHQIKSLDTKYANQSGELQMIGSLECSDKQYQAKLELPSSASPERKVKASAFLIGSDGTLLEAIKGFEVDLPK